MDKVSTGETRHWCDHTVDELMSSVPIKIPRDRQIRHARHEMAMARVRHLPVIDDGGFLVGIVSDRDVWRGLAQGLKPSDSVERIMTSRVCAVAPDTRLLEALDVMLERKIGALPVEGADGQVIGIVTETDLLLLLRALVTRRPPLGPQQAL